MERNTRNPASPEAPGVTNANPAGVGQGLKLTPREQAMLVELACKQWTFTKVERQSDREFDLKIEGFMGFGPYYNFTAWMPLLAIRELTDWTRIASMTDYPEMVREGDWSGVRDSSTETIWAIFEREVAK